MKNLVRFAVAGAMLAGFATAQAQSLPSTGSSDLWLFVADTSTGTTYAEDLGASALGGTNAQIAITASATAIAGNPLNRSWSADAAVGFPCQPRRWFIARHRSIRPARAPRTGSPPPFPRS